MLNIFTSLISVLLIALLALGASQIMTITTILAWIVPCVAFVVFLIGFIYRIIRWAGSPVPFNIPTTCGQEKSLPWITANPLDNPSSKVGVFVRMLLEIFFFRSLFRNIRMDMTNDRLVYGSAKWLWFFGLMFHWSLFFIVIRHLRFFIEPVPWLISFFTSADGFFEIGVPTLYLSDAAVLLALSFLFVRRVVVPEWRYISLFVDYFALFLIGGIVLTGLWMRLIQPADLLQIKELAMGWITLSPANPQGIGSVFFIHLFLVCVLLAWFSFSKLMHAGGILLSPTRNLANDSRAVRHINPWNSPVKVHTYEEYEDEFRDKMKAAGLPVEKQ